MFLMCTAFESLYLICYNIASVLFIYLGLKACSVLAPQPGIEPTSPTLEGGFLTTGPQENPQASLFIGEFKA